MLLMFLAIHCRMASVQRYVNNIRVRYGWVTPRSIWICILFHMPLWPQWFSKDVNFCHSQFAKNIHKRIMHFICAAIAIQFSFLKDSRASLERLSLRLRHKLCTLVTASGKPKPTSLTLYLMGDIGPISKTHRAQHETCSLAWVAAWGKAIFSWLWSHFSSAL